jgi:hypothetical protein
MHHALVMMSLLSLYRRPLSLLPCSSSATVGIRGLTLDMLLVLPSSLMMERTSPIF